VDLVAISVSHRTAPPQLRERLALSAGGAAQLMGELAAAHGVEEAVALCTCHRTELYVATPDPAAARRAALGALARLAVASEAELLGHVRVLRGGQVSRHLFAVAAGLESMVVGEAEIQGQVRSALERARAAGTAGPVTDRLFVDAVSSGGRRAHSAKAAVIVPEEEQRFETWLEAYRAAPAVAVLHEQAEAIVADVLTENERRWGHLTDADRARVGVLAL
jgi:glutamyl-tRNA reductase